MSENKPSTVELKKLLYNDGKPKFEFLRFIFTSAELQNEKPFVLLSLTCTRLGIKKENIKAKSFRQWLQRYRRKSKPAHSRSELPADLPGENATSSNFAFTDPSSIKKETSPLITFVN